MAVKTLPSGPSISTGEWHVDQRLGFSTYGVCAWWLQDGIRLERWVFFFIRVLEKTSAYIAVCEQEAIKIVLGDDDWSRIEGFKGW